MFINIHTNILNLPLSFIFITVYLKFTVSNTDVQHTWMKNYSIADKQTWFIVLHIFLKYNFTILHTFAWYAPVEGNLSHIREKHITLLERLVMNGLLPQRSWTQIKLSVEILTYVRKYMPYISKEKRKRMMNSGYMKQDFKEMTSVVHML